MRHIILTNKLKGPLGRLPRALSYHPLNILTRRHSRDDTVSTSFLYKRSCVTGVPGKHCAGMPVTTCLDESIWMQSKAHSDGSVYPVHHGAVYPTHVFPQAFFVQGPNLFQQDHGVLSKPNCRAANSMCVGSFAFPVWEVMAAAMTVGLWRLPVSFCTMSTGRTPPCSLPTTGLRSA